jgi:hypothetical protein
MGWHANIVNQHRLCPRPVGTAIEPNDPVPPGITGNNRWSARTIQIENLNVRDLGQATGTTDAFRGANKERTGWISTTDGTLLRKDLVPPTGKANDNSRQDHCGCQQAERSHRAILKEPISNSGKPMTHKGGIACNHFNRPASLQWPTR